MEQKMKKLLNSLLVLMSFFLVACHEEEIPTESMTNDVELTIPSTALLSEDDTTSVSVHAMIAFAPKEKVEIKLAFIGNDDNILRLEDENVVFNPGQKEAIVRVRSNGNHVLSVPRTVTLQVVSASTPSVKGFGKGVKITVKPDADIPALTPAQLQLIADVKTKYGVDLMRMIGKIPVETTITFNTADKETFFKGQAQRTYKGYSVITLADDTTVDAPTFKMVSNPMGLTTFLYDVLKRKTVEDEEFFMHTPYGRAAVKAADYKEDKETFDVSLGGITLDMPTKAITFTTQKENQYGDMITGLSFIYHYSLWDRLLQKRGSIVEIEEDGKIVGYTIDDDFFMQGGSLNPNKFLGMSNISNDEFGNDPSDWVAPSATLDLQKGKLSFLFPWDYADGNGYEQVSVVYTLRP